MRAKASGPLSNSDTLTIRPVRAEDHNAVWAILKPVFRAGDTYTIDPAISRDDALAYWCRPTHQTWVATRGDVVLGTYYIRPNQAGGGAHVCNCGYMVAASAAGQGLATQMCLHSQNIARELGYKAMQFNFVAKSNEGAVHLWKKLGFEIVGCLPKAFKHPSQGYVDALVMYKWL